MIYTHIFGFFIKCIPVSAEFADCPSRVFVNVDRTQIPVTMDSLGGLFSSTGGLKMEAQVGCGPGRREPIRMRWNLNTIELQDGVHVQEWCESRNVIIVTDGLSPCAVLW